MTDQASPMWSIFGQFITWGLVVWGWAIVSELQDFRELRKDRLSRLGNLRDQLTSTEGEALEFHTTEFDGRKALALQSVLGSIGRELAFLEACRYILLDYQDALIDLRQACTEENFDKSTHTARDHADVLCTTIMGARAQLETVLIEAQKGAATAEANPGGILRRHIKQTVAYLRGKWQHRTRWGADEEF